MMIGTANLGSISLRPSCMTDHVHLWLRIKSRAAERILKACSNARRGTVHYHTLLCEHLHQIYLWLQWLILHNLFCLFSRDQLEHEAVFVDHSVCPGCLSTYPSRSRLIPLAVCIHILVFVLYLKASISCNYEVSMTSVIFSSCSLKFSRGINSSLVDETDRMDLRRYLCSSSSTASKNRLLDKHQKKICRTEIQFMKYVVSAAELAKEECLRLSKYERWDCSGVLKLPKFSKDLRVGMLTKH